MMRVLSVPELTAYIKDLLDSDPILGSVWVRGEISNFTRSAAGHIYFTLKAEKAQIRCAFFRGLNQSLTFQPVNGDEVIAHGNVSFWDGSGQIQLYVDLLQPAGTGLLQMQFAELRAKLEREGLFDQDRKRPLPAFPRHIGVVTSPTGAVWQDIQHVLSRRYPLAELILAPAQVQGDGAPKSVISALQALQDDGRAEVIIIARGGGSMEDLWCFNDEQLARAVFASRVPVISAVGHETDFTICDFVADMRAPTPSAAAEIVAPPLREIRLMLDDLLDRALQGALRPLRTRQTELAHLTARLQRQSPEHSIGKCRMHIESRARELDRQIDGRVRNERARIQALGRQLALLHPVQIMERGYAIVLDRASGERVDTAAEASDGQELLLRFHDGSVAATVDRRHLTEERDDVGRES